MVHPEQLENSLKQSLLFEGVSGNEINRIAGTAKARRINQGEYIHRSGDAGRRFYVVATGEVELTLDRESSGSTLVGHIGPGGHFGETSLLTGNHYTLTARALSEVLLVCFDTHTFFSVLLANKIIHRQLGVSLAKRLLVSFQDKADISSQVRKVHTQQGQRLDAPLFNQDDDQQFFQSGITLPKHQPNDEFDSAIAKRTKQMIKDFSANLDPVLLTGEANTGRRMIAQEIHRADTLHDGAILEIDMREVHPTMRDGELFGNERDALPFTQLGQLGALEQCHSGTVIIHHPEVMDMMLQEKLATVLTDKQFCRVSGDELINLRSRLVFIYGEVHSAGSQEYQLHPKLLTVLKQQFRVAPIREHRRDIPRLVRHYLRHYSQQYNKTIETIEPQTLGVLINYEWPGNLTELATVIQRAVMLGKDHEPLNDQILLGLPKTEGKWEFNLLRLPWIRKLLESRLYPILPKAIIAVVFLFVLSALFLGPAGPQNNIGLTLSWIIGWPLLFFSFFFLARTWCSVCPLPVPGWFAQVLKKPTRSTPKFIKDYSGWMMTALCILVLWVETVWNVYDRPYMTAYIILFVAAGAFLFSLLYKRRVWCRYLCPLGAMNAIFSMPSVLELRANTHMCLNRCSDHSCYRGDQEIEGCQMFRHPFLVDNNRDCMLCTDCIKSCKLNSVHLNLRLAPQELWGQQSPRVADSFLVVSLAAIFFPFALDNHFPTLIENIGLSVQHSLGIAMPQPLLASLLFFSVVLFYQLGYTALSYIMAWVTGSDLRLTFALFGYGMIPLVLGAYLAAHFEIFIAGAILLVPNLNELFGVTAEYTGKRLLSPDATFVIQIISVVGGLIASLYATLRILSRLQGRKPVQFRVFSIPGSLLCISALAYLFIL